MEWLVKTHSSLGIKNLSSSVIIRPGALIHCTVDSAELLSVCMGRHCHSELEQKDIWFAIHRKKEFVSSVQEKDFKEVFIPDSGF